MVHQHGIWHGISFPLKHLKGLQEVQERTDTGSGWVLKQSLQQPQCSSLREKLRCVAAGSRAGLNDLGGFYINLISNLMVLWSPSCLGPELDNLPSAPHSQCSGLEGHLPTGLGPPHINRICFIFNKKLDSPHLSLFTYFYIK